MGQNPKMQTKMQEKWITIEEAKEINLSKIVYCQCGIR